MNLTYLVGNGADINLGMKSQYKQFYEYVEESKPNLVKANILFKLIEKDKECWSYFEKMIGAISCYSKDDNELSQNLDLLDFNFSDEEKEKIIKNFSNEEMFEEFEENTLLNYVEEFRSEFELYLLEEEKRVVNELKENNNLNSLLETLVNFWFKNPYEAIDYDWKISPNELFFQELSTELKKKYERISNQTKKVFEINYNILNFNYTSVISAFFETETELNVILQDKWEEIFRERFPEYTNLSVRVKFFNFHIHENIENGMFLGVDNIKQLNTKFILDDDIKRILVKPDRIQMLDEMDDSLGKKYSQFKSLISTSHYIFVFGMSFGETDKTWWEWILSRLNADDSFLRRVNIYDYNITPQIRKGMFYNKLYRQSQYHLTKYSNVNEEDNSKNEKNIRVVGRSEKIFKILKANDEEGK